MNAMNRSARATRSSLPSSEESLFNLMIAHAQNVRLHLFVQGMNLYWLDLLGSQLYEGVVPDLTYFPLNNPAE
jgi:hypothetical protein